MEGTGWRVEATAGFEPTNRGFAVPRLKPLGYVAPSSTGENPEVGVLRSVWLVAGAEEEI